MFAVFLGVSSYLEKDELIVVSFAAHQIQTVWVGGEPAQGVGSICNWFTNNS